MFTKPFLATMLSATRVVDVDDVTTDDLLDMIIAGKNPKKRAPED